ncbi:MAG: T9SS type A sorting domain-containing protein [Bacteroidota bacterium]
MKTLLLSVASVIIFITGVAQKKKSPYSPSSNMSSLQNVSSDDNWFEKTQAYLKETEACFKKQTYSEGYYTWNRKQGIGFTASACGYSISPVRLSNKPATSKEWETGLTFLKIKRGTQFLEPENEYWVNQNKSALHYNFPGFSIEYINEKNGIRQNFIVSKKLAGSKSLEVLLNIKGNLFGSIANNRLCLKDKDGTTQLYYQDLNVWDADHNKLEASMKMENENTLAIVVNDQNATYPITVDPINQTPEWTTSADGILPTLVGQLAVDAAYGFSVAGLGDVNADGFDDVAVGSPAMVDLVSGTGAFASVGAVFVYYGSINGLPVIPDAKLQPTTAVAGALFGYSVAGGDINNDGKADIIVGAPLDNVSISIGGGNTAHGTVGKVYAFNGATLSTSTSPCVTLQLSGSGILENGINLSVNALFGFSVAVTEDLNGDGKNDMIVGAPTYAGIKNGLFGVHLLDVQSGGAFVFLTNATNNNVTLSKLDPIKSGILGLGILNSNINGLLFGYSVDGLGDYNGDGKPDVVVSAPAGVDASSITGLLNGKVFQGSASVFYGTGSGVNTNPGATLTATSGGLISNLSGSIGNVANLFGLTVKAARDADGTRNGNVLVGAPLGGALTNILGLQLKTGTVNIFRKNVVSPLGYVAPDQILSSPRNDNNILGLIQANLLYGYSLNNIFDVNCDGIGDIIIGEPASSGVQLLNVNIAGGAAYVYLGKSDGTYQNEPSWTLTAYEDEFLGANATSLIGYSVAGAGRVRGIDNNNRILIGSPSRTLDFGSGLLNLGNTVGTIFSLVAGGNGVGKAYSFDTHLCPGVLALSLTGLKGNYSNGISGLTWQTAQEINYKHFEIEKSIDGNRFYYIGKVTAKGNSNTRINYNFNDNNIYSTNNYYRIKLIDNDHRFIYSPVIFLDASGKKNNNITMSPNPFVDKLIIKVFTTKNDIVRIKIFDNSGKPLVNQIQTVQAGISKITIPNLEKLSAGIYIAEIRLNDSVVSQKIIK